MRFHVEVRLTPPLAVVRVHGDLDLDTEHHLGGALDQALRQGCTFAAVDLGGVTFMDCSALGTLVGAARRLGAAGCRLSVTATSPQVKRLLGLTGTGWLTDVDGGAALLTVAERA